LIKSLKRLGEPQRTLVELGLLLLCAVLIWQALWFSLSLCLRTEHPVVIVAIDMTPWYVTSMTPTLGAGDILLIEGVNPSTLKASTPLHQDGDVIVFRHPYYVHTEWSWWELKWVEEPDLIVHRVVAKSISGNITYLYTKGDHNSVEDPYAITGDAVVGKWTGFKIPFIGLVFLAAQDPTGRTIIIIALILMLFYEIYGSTRKKSHSPETTFASDP
jgi:signal peptidase I